MSKTDQQKIGVLG